jgi:hypothetical protein
MPSDQDCAPDLIVRTQDWPHGLRCGECDRVMNDGDRYAKQLVGMAGDTPVVMIVCCPCDEGQHTIITD